MSETRYSCRGCYHFAGDHGMKDHCNAIEGYTWDQYSLDKQRRCFDDRPLKNPPLDNSGLRLVAYMTGDLQSWQYPIRKKLDELQSFGWFHKFVGEGYAMIEKEDGKMMFIEARLMRFCYPPTIEATT